MNARGGPYAAIPLRCDLEAHHVVTGRRSLVNCASAAEDLSGSTSSCASDAAPHRCRPAIAHFFAAAVLLL